MKLFKPLLSFIAILLLSFNGLAQKQTYDIVSYTVPKGWQSQQAEGGVQLFITDAKTGGYAIAIVTKGMPSSGSAENDFSNQWKSLLVNTVNSITEPVKIEPVQDEGWEIHSGNGNYVDGNIKGLATLITATGNDQTVAAVLMTNTQQYQNDLLTFINSLELKKFQQQNTRNTNPTTVKAGDSNPTSLIGLWVAYRNETSGFMNGTPMYSGGYFRNEYAFNADGTYVYRSKNWSTTIKDILFVYETGTWKVNSNSVTLTPAKGKGEWWSKAPSGRTSEWGKLVKSSTLKLEPVTYTFELKNFSETTLLLQSPNETQREGRQENNTASYTTRATDKSLIDNPPGFKTASENTLSNSAINSPIAGKIWEAQTLEKNGAAYGNTSGFHTGGFWLYQYQFNTDGTYHFIYNAASALATNPVNVLQYETGTYSVSGSQLTITPLKGANEEWSVSSINNGMSAETKRNTLEKRIEKLKTSQRKLEKTTYVFTIEYWQGNNANALCLKHTQNTIREGSPGANDQSCFFETTAAKSALFTK